VSDEGAAFKYCPKVCSSIETAFRNIPEIGRSIANLSIHRLPKNMLKLRDNVVP
jgi:hypothetical protein